jgi:ABC-type dipeptide/oligopeptide/nickel transport system permease component
MEQITLKEPEPPRKESDHQIAIHGFDGEPTTIVQADEIRFFAPTKKCVTFWSTIIACFLAIGLGVFFMIYQGTTSPYYSFGMALIGLGVGVLIPGAFSFFLGPFPHPHLCYQGPNFASVVQKQAAAIAPIA